MNLYESFAQATQLGDLHTCLMMDMKACQEDDVRLLCHLTPSIYTEVSTLICVPGTARQCCWARETASSRCTQPSPSSPLRCWPQQAPSPTPQPSPPASFHYVEKCLKPTEFLSCKLGLGLSTCPLCFGPILWTQDRQGSQPDPCSHIQALWPSDGPSSSLSFLSRPGPL